MRPKYLFGEVVHQCRNRVRSQLSSKEYAARVAPMRQVLLREMEGGKSIGEAANDWVSERNRTGQRDGIEHCWCAAVDLDEEMSRAVDVLVKRMHPDNLDRVRLLMFRHRNRSDHRWHEDHMALGAQVRDVLRESKLPFSDQWLDDHWHEFIERAARIGKR